MAALTIGDFTLDPNYRPIDNLDGLPLPARELVDMPAYLAAAGRAKVLPKQQPATTIMTARGCPRHCTFCAAPALYARAYKMRSPENVMAEIDLLVERYGVREIVILDENFAVNRQRVDRILDLLAERDYGLTWFCASGLEIPTLTESMLEKMAMTGLYKLKLSFESGNQRVLKDLIKKPIDLRHGERIVRKAQELGLPIGANFVIGYPGETRAEIMDSFAFAKRLDIDFTLWNLATPYPNTELTKQAISDGLLPRDFDYTELKPGTAFFDSADVDRGELARMRYDFWHELHFSDPVRTQRYDRYARPNPNYQPPLPTGGPRCELPDVG